MSTLFLEIITVLVNAMYAFFFISLLQISAMSDYGKNCNGIKINKSCCYI